jgi:hypothetical protein
MDLFIKQTSAMGRGVFANRDFAAGEIIEECPILRLPSSNMIAPLWQQEYAFTFDGQPVLALGYGSLYNHSDKPNATYDISKRKQRVIIKACQLIRRRSQIFIDYGWNEDDLRSAWRMFRRAK